MVFKQEEILNFELLEYLLSTKGDGKNSNYVIYFFRQIKENTNLDFAAKYYVADKRRKEFVVAINERWPEFFSIVLRDSGNTMPDDQIRRFSEDTLAYSDISVLSNVNIEGCLSNYIADSADYLMLKDVDIQKIITALQNLKVRFAAIETNDINWELFDAVYKGHMYRFTFENIALMLKEQYGCCDESDIRHKNYTLVRSLPDAPLAAYVACNMELYAKTILKYCASAIKDEPDAAVALLNDGDVSAESKGEYIGFLQTVLPVYPLLRTNNSGDCC